jgi:CRISPR-associated protein Csb2
MPQYLCISATLLANAYHPMGPDAWPPAPARLLKAMLAGVMTGAYRKQWSSLEPAFRWLEAQEPPVIVAAPAHRLPSPYRIAVPNNDLDVAAQQWRKGKPYDASKLKTMKEIQPAFLPPQSPHLHYLWPVPSAEHVPELRRLSHCLHTLGWGVDMAFADAALLSESDALALSGERFEPAPQGSLQLEIPVPGFLDDLLVTYKKFTSRQGKKGVDPDPRPTVYGVQLYRPVLSQSQRPWAVFHLRNPNDWETSIAHPWALSRDVAAWLRHATAQALLEEGLPEDFVNSYALGHPNAANSESNSSRISYLPLPSIGHRYVYGLIRRVALVEPIGGETPYLALLERKLSGRVLTAPNGQPAALLAPAAGDPAVLRYYVDPSSTWQSVTPVILHGHNTQRRSLSLPKTEKLLLQAFAAAGHPESSIRSLVFQNAPFFTTGPARSAKPPAHLDNWPRYHVSVTFSQPIAGPVTAGIGRHYGLGLFASTSESREPIG